MIVLELLASRHFTGPAESLIRLMDGLAARGHRVFFAHTQTPPGTLADKLRGVSFQVLDDVKLARKGLLLPGAIRDIQVLKKFIDAQPADEPVIVHTHASHDHWIGLALLKLRPGRVVLVRSVHETRLAMRRTGDVPLFKACHGIITISAGMKERLCASYRLQENKVAVVRGSVDAQLYRPGLDVTEIRREIDAAPDGPVFGIVSRIKSGRGHSLLLRAVAPLAQRHSGLRLLIVGRGEGREELEDTVRRNGWDSWVRFLGYRRGDLPQIYCALRAKIILGEGSDGTCRAALEAMSCGVPVIAARVGALPETIQHGRTGFLIDPNDEEGLRSAIEFFINNPLDARQFGNEARADIEKRFTADRMADDVEAFFRHCLEKARKSGSAQ